MRLLVVYNQNPCQKQRRTVGDSIFCYGKYARKNEVFYLNYLPRFGETVRILRLFKFDAVLFHYTFLALRWCGGEEWQKVLTDFKDIWPEAVKGVLPQDEHSETERIREFVREAGIDIIYTLASGRNRRLLYPKGQVTVKKIYTVFTAYVEDETLKEILELSENIGGGYRPYDMGYRARKVEYTLGRHGTLKTRIAEIFSQKASEYGMKADIKNTGDYKNVFFGMDWFRFLLSCRTMPGCLGGASIMDEDGSLEKRSRRYLRAHRGASFQEVFEDVLRDYEGNIDYTAISPRLFECAMTKTCQILIEGDYKVIRPDVHYISVKKDFSNIDEVMERVRDAEACGEMAERTYRDVIASGKYTYAVYVNHILRTLGRERKASVKRRCRIPLTYLFKGYDSFLERYYERYR